MTDEQQKCSYCGRAIECCETIREDSAFWMGLHAERPDVVALREQQRQARIAAGHETPWDGGLKVHGFTAGTPDDDPNAIARHQIAKWRRGRR